MEQIGLFQAKTHLSQIVDQVQKSGRAVTLTRRGIPVAEIRPLAEEPEMTREQAFEAIRQMRSSMPRITAVEIREAIDEGRM
ncbi:MAG: type II toxin-antitoxin system prevent-host-death family antitoxin [Phycisphaeraceae bacterium]